MGRHTLTTVIMSVLTLCMMCLVIMQGVHGRKISEQESFLTRVKRESCDPDGAQECVLTTWQTYMDAIYDENHQVKPVPAGEKPDYFERKTCNFLLDTQKCYDMLENCGLPADQLKAKKDAASKQARDSANKLLNWDDEKCQSADPNTPKQAKQSNPEPKKEEGEGEKEEGKGAGASVVTSLFSVLVLAGFASKL